MTLNTHQEPPVHRSYVPISYTHDYKADLLERDIKLPTSVKTASIKRQCEFLAGRQCAITCLQEAGCSSPLQIGIGAKGAPVWPEGYTGSISHTDHLASAIVSATPAKTLSLGLDLETVMSADTALGIKDRIITNDECRFQSAFSRFEQFLTVVFSAKESLYKAISARTTKILDFDTVQLSEVCISEQQLILSTTQTINTYLPEGKRYCIKYRWLRPDIIETLAVVRNN